MSSVWRGQRPPGRWPQGMAPAAPAAQMEWGAHPELVGPRHYYRVGLMARVLAAALPRADAPWVLDAGAGRGTLARLLARRGYRVAALDESAAFVRYLAASHGGARRLPAWPARGDVARLPFANGAFQGVVCGEVLEHLADDAGALAELARVTRPGGILVLTVPLGRARYSSLDRWAGHVRRYEADELRRLLADAGFQVRELRHLGFPFGLLYEQLVQRPVLGREARGGAAPLAVGVGRSRAARVMGELLFRLDEPWTAVRRGTGLLAVARRADANAMPTRGSEAAALGRRGREIW